jgi:hypothetical protein
MSSWSVNIQVHRKEMEAAENWKKMKVIPAFE